MLPNPSRLSACSLLGVVALLVAASAFADDDLAKLIAGVKPSVVTVEVLDGDAGNGFVFSGSGFIVSDDGIMATCYHVVEGAKDVRVKLHDGKILEVAGFVAVSPGKDIILLKVKSPDKLSPLRIAGNLPAQGARVFTFGAPRGLAGSVSDGIVSAIRNELDVRQVLKESAGDLDAVWVQTTAPISGGNSGGPLINNDGAVVGLNAWSQPQGQNLNFAIAAKFAQGLLEDADKSVHALAEIPVIDPAAPVAANSNGQRTLAYWAMVSQAKQHRADAMARVKTLAQTAASKERAQAALETAMAWRSYFEEVKAISVDSVDAELLWLATLDAQYSEKMTNVLQAVIQLYDTNQRNAAAATWRAGSRPLAKPLADIQEEYDFLRILLNARYKLDFPAMPAPVHLVQADREAREAERRERLAARTLRIGKDFWNSPDRKKQALAKSWFKRVVSQFPGTVAAGEAAKLLKQEE